MTRRVSPTPRVLRAASRATAPVRSDAETRALHDLERWRSSAVPDATTPLEAEDLVGLLRDCIATLQLDAAVAAGVSVNTVHYYRRKDVIDPPIGKTVSARYEIRHLWQIAGARLAGHLGLVTLAEARNVIRGADETTSMAFLAARVADARARDAIRDTRSTSRAVREIRPLPGVAVDIGTIAATTRATIVTLPGDAWCVIPAAHAAMQSAEAADALVRALAVALGTAKYS